MRQLLLILSVLYCSFCQALDDETQAKLSSLLTLLDIKHEQTITSITQAFHLFQRKPGVERWEMPEWRLDANIQNEASRMLKNLGFVDAIKPEQKSFDYVILLGGTVKRMEIRLNHLIKLTENGISFRKMVVLASQRPMDATGDDTDSLRASIAHHYNIPLLKASTPNTECEAAKMLISLSENRLGELYKNIAFIDVPRFWDNGSWKRANTGNTIEAWLKTQPEAGSVLVVSSQPHAHYQYEVIKSALPTNFSIMLATEAMDKNCPFIVQLNALALWLDNKEH